MRSPCELPAFVRLQHTRRSVRNPEGYCREHGCTLATPINVDPSSGIWRDNCCGCVVGDPGLEPCDVCGGGVTPPHKTCRLGETCCEVMACYEWMCKTLIREKQFGPHFVAEELRRREEAHTRYSKLQACTRVVV